MINVLAFIGAFSCLSLSLFGLWYLFVQLPNQRALKRPVHVLSAQERFRLLVEQNEAVN